MNITQILSLIIFKLTPGIYTFKHLSEALFNNLQPECSGPLNVIYIEFDDITMKTKVAAKPGIIARSFYEQSFFSTLLGFNHVLDYKHYNKYINQKIVNISSRKKYT